MLSDGNADLLAQRVWGKWQWERANQQLRQHDQQQQMADEDRVTAAVMRCIDNGQHCNWLE